MTRSRDTTRLASLFTSPINFEAVGDNVADDTVPIDLSLIYALANKLPWYLPAGRYRYVGQLLVDLISVYNTGFKMYGDGTNSSIIDFGTVAAPAFFLTCSRTPGDCFYPEISGIGFVANCAGPVVRLGKTDFSDPINKPIFRFAAGNLNTTSAAVGCEINHVLNGDMNIETNCGLVGPDVGAGRSLVARQLIMSRVHGSCSTAEVGISFEDGFSYGNVFEAMDIENVEDCVHQLSTNADKNTFLGGTFVYSGFGAVSTVNRQMIFDNVNAAPQGGSTLANFIDPARKDGLIARDVVGYRTKNKGSQTVTAASTLTFNHGLIAAPSAQDVTLTPLATATTGIWLSGVSSTTITVSFPTSVTGTFAWSATVAGA